MQSEIISMSIKAARISGLEVSVCGVGELPDFADQGEFADGLLGHNGLMIVREERTFSLVSHFPSIYNPCSTPLPFCDPA